MYVIEPLSSLAELDEVLTIEQASFTNPWTRAMYVAELKHSGVAHIYLARTEAPEAQRTAGFCSFWRVADELHINNLAVAPDFRRRGVGSALLTRVLADAARLGATRALLEVRASNEPARLLYERFGFTRSGTRRNYYTHPIEDALLLWRTGLSQP